MEPVAALSPFGNNGRMWTRVAAAAGCFAAIMGFSRLAYGVLVPPMRASLGGSFSLYGAIGTANMVGYLAGALLTTRLGRRPDRSRVNLAALVAMGCAMGACGVVSEPLWLGVLRFAVGVASGIALALTLALAVEAVPSQSRGMAAAVIWGGGCAGIAAVGFANTFPFAAAPGAWRIEWIGMALLGFALTALFARTTGGAFAAGERRDAGGPVGIFARPRYRALAVAYFAFGIGYIDVVTFFGAALHDVPRMSPGAMWTLLGAAGVAGVAVWGPLVDRLRSGVPVALASAACALGAALAAFGGPAGALIGALAIGVSFIGIPAMVGALMQQREPAVRYPRAFAAMTAVLGVGQIIGPLAGGLVADRFGTVGALTLGAAVLGCGSVAATFYRRPVEDEVLRPGAGRAGLRLS